MHACILVQMQDAGGAEFSARSIRRRAPKPVAPLGR
jgi:hypothetical protein